MNKSTSIIILVVFISFIICNCNINISANIDQLRNDQAPNIGYAQYTNFNFNKPVELQYNVAMDELFVVEQEGIIYRIDESKNIFLDLSDRVHVTGEMGLLGLIFHPDFASNGKFYIDYNLDSPLRTIVSEITIGSNGIANVSSERILLEVEQPYTNHNAGSLVFGADNYLYITLGDGGSSGDPNNNGQDPTTLLGSILRIDVNNEGDGTPYAIPEDNPFMGHSENRKEIYAYGLRNPWKMSYDTEADLLIAADVGQNWIEEVNIIEAGNNYGWNQMEGSSCYVSSCDTSGKSNPFTEYNHTVGTTITGGYIDRVDDSTLFGHYIFGDFSTGEVFAYNMSDLTSNYFSLFDTPYLISTFGILGDNSIIFADYDEGGLYLLVDDIQNNPQSSSSMISSIAGSSTSTTEVSSETTSSVEQSSTSLSDLSGLGDPNLLVFLLTSSTLMMVIRKASKKNKSKLIRTSK